MPKNKDTNLFKTLEGDSFQFSCHKDISCFTQCCAKLQLILTPYDVLCIKNRLGLHSQDFLTKHTDTIFRDHSRFPLITLMMNNDEDKKCPFVTKDGCTIYEDRPGACRLYPLARASTMANPKTGMQEKFFIVAESHCTGFQEDHLWSLDEWLNHEGVSEYNAMNDEWVGIITSGKDLGAGGEISKKLQMFFMASYNLDRFRDFIFKTSFFDHFQADQKTRQRLANDDTVLMLFAFDWLKFSLYGEETMTLCA
jgi:Fe-S-cluster containining protein